MADAFDQFLQNLDGDLDVLFKPLINRVNGVIDAATKGTIPKDKARAAINKELEQLFGASAADVPYTAFGKYAKATAHAAKMVGYGKPLATNLLEETHGSTTPIRAQRARKHLQALLNAQVAALKTVKTEPQKTKAKQFMADFLQVKGASKPVVKSNLKGLHEIRRLLVTEATRAYGQGLMATALTQAKRVRWVKATNHIGSDICDEHASKDNGFGPGVYNPSDVPVYPAHPYCKCRLEMVHVDNITISFAGSTSKPLTWGEAVIGTPVKVDGTSSTGTIVGKTAATGLVDVQLSTGSVGKFYADELVKVTPKSPASSPTMDSPQVGDTIKMHINGAKGKITAVDGSSYTIQFESTPFPSNFIKASQFSVIEKASAPKKKIEKPVIGGKVLTPAGDIGTIIGLAPVPKGSVVVSYLGGKVVGIFLPSEITLMPLETPLSPSPTKVQQTVGKFTTGDTVVIKNAKGIKHVGESGIVIGFSASGSTVKVKFADGSQASYVPGHVVFAAHGVVKVDAVLPGPGPAKFAVGEKVTIKDAKGIKHVGEEGEVFGFSPNGTTIKVKFADGTSMSYAVPHVLKGAPSQPPPPPPKSPVAPLEPLLQTPLAISGFDIAAAKKVGGQLGSNPGAMYEDAAGQKWYVKAPQGTDVEKKVANEILAAKLYELAGIKSASLEKSTFDGKPGIASKIEDVQDLSVEQMAQKGAAEGFAVDAWLANWDVIGNGGPQAMNLKALKNGGGLIRIDTGGALLYRAQGGLKGDAFGDTVEELKTFKNPSVNANAAAVYGKMTDQQTMDSMEKVLAIKDEDIRTLIMQHGPGSIQERTLLADKMIARKYNIQLEYNKLIAKTIPAAPAVKVVEDAVVTPAVANKYSQEALDKLIHAAGHKFVVGEETYSYDLGIYGKVLKVYTNGDVEVHFTDLETGTDVLDIFKPDTLHYVPSTPPAAATPTQATTKVMPRFQPGDKVFVAAKNAEGTVLTKPTTAGAVQVLMDNGTKYNASLSTLSKVSQTQQTGAMKVDDVITVNLFGSQVTGKIASLDTENGFGNIVDANGKIHFFFKGDVLVHTHDKYIPKDTTELLSLTADEQGFATFDAAFSDEQMLQFDIEENALGDLPQSSSLVLEVGDTVTVSKAGQPVTAKVVAVQVGRNAEGIQVNVATQADGTVVHFTKGEVTSHTSAFAAQLAVNPATGLPDLSQFVPPKVIRPKVTVGVAVLDDIGNHGVISEVAPLGYADGSIVIKYTSGMTKVVPHGQFKTLPFLMGDYVQLNKDSGFDGKKGSIVGYDQNGNPKVKLDDGGIVTVFVEDATAATKLTIPKGAVLKNEWGQSVLIQSVNADGTFSIKNLSTELESTHSYADVKEWTPVPKSTVLQKGDIVVITDGLYAGKTAVVNDADDGGVYYTPQGKTESHFSSKPSNFHKVYGPESPAKVVAGDQVISPEGFYVTVAKVDAKGELTGILNANGKTVILVPGQYKYIDLSLSKVSDFTGTLDSEGAALAVGSKVLCPFNEIGTVEGFTDSGKIKIIFSDGSKAAYPSESIDLIKAEPPAPSYEVGEVVETQWGSTAIIVEKKPNGEIYIKAMYEDPDLEPSIVYADELKKVPNQPITSEPVALSVGDIAVTQFGSKVTIKAVLPNGKLKIAYNDGSTDSVSSEFLTKQVVAPKLATEVIQLGDKAVTSFGEAVTIIEIKPNGTIVGLYADGSGITEEFLPIELKKTSSLTKPNLNDYIIDGGGNTVQVYKVFADGSVQGYNMQTYEPGTYVIQVPKVEETPPSPSNNPKPGDKVKLTSGFTVEITSIVEPGIFKVKLSNGVVKTAFAGEIVTEGNDPVQPMISSNQPAPPPLTQTVTPASLSGPAAKFNLGEVVTIKAGQKNAGKQGTVVGASTAGTTVKVKFADGSQASYSTTHATKGSYGTYASSSKVVPPPTAKPIQKSGPVPSPVNGTTNDMGQVVHYSSFKAGGLVEGHISGVNTLGQYLVKVGDAEYPVNASILTFGPKPIAPVYAYTPPPIPTYTPPPPKVSKPQKQVAHPLATAGGFEPLESYPDEDKAVGDAPPSWTQEWKNFLANLPASHRSSLYHWSGGAYVEMNEHLRAGRPPSVGEKAAHYARIDKAMRASSVPKDMVVYRSGSFGDKWDEFDSIRPGQITHDLGYTATAVVTGAFGDGAIQIRVPQGTKGIYIDSISQFGASSWKPERELLLARGTKFRCISNPPLIFEIVSQEP